jgi:hypothetical protein
MKAARTTSTGARRWRYAALGLVVATSAAGTSVLRAAPQQALQPPNIPLVTNLHIDWAWRGDSVEGDYTPFFLVTKTDSFAVDALVHAYKGVRGGGKETVDIDTRMSRATMRDGRVYRQIWITTDPLVMTNTTSMMLSTAVYNDVVSKGSAALTIVDDIHLNGRLGGLLSQWVSLARALTSDSVPTGTPYSGTITRVEPGIVPFAVLVNNRLVMLPTIHVHGTLSHDGEPYHADLRVLAEPSFPLVLAADSAAAKAGGVLGGRVTSITFPDTGSTNRIERDLAERRPVEIYNIYFDYNSAVIKPPSDSVLQTLGTILHRHPDWTLRVTGHTDSIGGSGQGNQRLSARRADAVRTGADDDLRSRR